MLSAEVDMSEIIQRENGMKLNFILCQEILLENTQKYHTKKDFCCQIVPYRMLVIQMDDSTNVSHTFQLMVSAKFCFSNGIREESHF